MWMKLLLVDEKEDTERVNTNVNSNHKSIIENYENETESRCCPAELDMDEATGDKQQRRHASVQENDTEATSFSSSFGHASNQPNKLSVESDRIHVDGL
jgi:hypothetical protein